MTVRPHHMVYTIVMMTVVIQMMTTMRVMMEMTVMKVVSGLPQSAQ